MCELPFGPMDIGAYLHDRLEEPRLVDVSTGLMLVFATSLCKECGVKLCGQDRGQLHCPTGTDGEPVIEQVMNTLQDERRRHQGTGSAGAA